MKKIPGWFILPVFAVLAAGYLCGVRLYVVRSGSMEPAIMTGALCFEEAGAAYEDRKVGDVVVFSAADSLVAHRVIRILPEGFVTKGDANDCEDGISVTKDNYHGVVLFSIPWLGYLISFFGERRGRILGITAILSLLLLSAILAGEGEKEEHQR